MASTLLRASNDQVISLRAWKNIFSGWWPKSCPHVGACRGRKPSYAAAGCSPTLAASRKRGQRSSNPGWTVLRQARGRQTRKLPAGHLGTFLRRRLLRMRYTASCVQICDARIRGERHANQFACNKEVTRPRFLPFLLPSGDNVKLLSSMRCYGLAATVTCRHEVRQQPPRTRLLQSVVHCFIAWV